VKLLHTADWHLNARLGGIDRTTHLRQRVEEVAGICEREGVDVLIIAGDLFSEQAEVTARVNQVADSFRHLRQTFAEFFARGGIILGVTGNHDQDGRVMPNLTLARVGMDIAEPPRKRGDHFTPGRMYLLDTAFVGRVHDSRERFDVQFALLPFPGLSRILTGAETVTTSAEFNRPVGEQVSNWIRSLPKWSGYDENLRTVLVAHLNVTGADVGRGMFRGSETSSVLLDAAVLPTGFDYVALGHLHKPQCIRDQDHIRYSGSLDRMDHGDDDPMKQVVLVDIGPEGRRGVTSIPIEPTQFITATITNAETAAEQIRTQVPDRSSALVRVVVEPTATDASSTVDIAIRDTLPGIVTKVEWQYPEPANGSISRAKPAGGSVRERVLDYLARNVPLECRDDLLALTVEFLDRDGHR
jgi:DNA repair protein SbcD/Mre11